MHPRVLTHTARLFLPLLFLTLAACGGGGGDSPSAAAGGGAPATLTITTASLPGGSTGTPYGATQLGAVNVEGAAVWSVDNGSLPAGLSLSTSGVVSGTPAQAGSYPFVVRIDDDVSMDTQSLLVSVDVLGLSTLSGLTAGEAWSGRNVLLVASGQSGSLTFSVTSNGSGGSFTVQNPAAGTATWTPGVTAGPGVVDTLRATDGPGGSTSELTFTVQPHPAANHTASFGSSDVWYVDPTPKEGSHSYVSDFHKGLVDAGFRDPASTGATGTTADDVAALWIRVEVLRHVAPMFLRNVDGSAGAQGLGITFPLNAPGAGYTRPSPGNSLVGSPTRYSVMALVRGTQGGVIGTAFLDGTANGWHENDTTSGSLELGVFTNQIVPFVNSAWSNPLPNNPIGANDVPALKALLYGTASPGGRYNTLRAQGRGLAKSLAAVIAHEIGHSLGLSHTNPSVTSSIMNPSAAMGPTISYVFTSADVTRLQTALPGTGKSTGALQSLTVSTSRPGGVVVCQCRGCVVKTKAPASAKRKTP